MFASRVLVHYHDFAAPWFLALLSAGTVAIAARLLVFLIAADDGSSGKDWLQLCLIGVIMWTSVALNIASVRSIPVPVVLLIQVSILLSSGEWCWNVARPAMHHPLVAVCHGVWRALWRPLQCAGASAPLSILSTFECSTVQFESGMHAARGAMPYLEA